jgi:hypothetical protein
LNTITASTAPSRFIRRRRNWALTSRCPSVMPVCKRVTGSKSELESSWRARQSCWSRRQSTKPISPLDSAAHSANAPCQSAVTPGTCIAVAYMPAIAGKVNRQPNAIAGASGSPISEARQITQSVSEAASSDKAPATGSCCWEAGRA